MEDEKRLDAGIQLQQPPRALLRGHALNNRPETAKHDSGVCVGVCGGWSPLSLPSKEFAEMVPRQRR